MKRQLSNETCQWITKSAISTCIIAGTQPKVQIHTIDSCAFLRLHMRNGQVPIMSHLLRLQNLSGHCGIRRRLKHEGVKCTFHCHPGPYELAFVVGVEFLWFLLLRLRLIVTTSTSSSSHSILANILHIVVFFITDIEILPLPSHPHRHQPRIPLNRLLSPLRHHQRQFRHLAFQHSPRNTILLRVQIDLRPMIRMTHISDPKQCHLHRSGGILLQFPRVLRRLFFLGQFPLLVHLFVLPLPSLNLLHDPRFHLTRIQHRLISQDFHVIR
mmetsp:Transcript_16418/g.34492  ORF Transcript_16418/g.34492 Transcript_16418/m.34492 type:complete len:270 (-) Transcript_16418:948-1757(-)